MAKESTYPPISLEVEVIRGHVHNVRNTDGGMMDPTCSLHVYDYNKRWSKSILEPDEKGELCKQTIYLGSSNVKNKFRLYIREGKVFRVVMPIPGVEVVVKTIPAKGDTETQKWVSKAQPKK